MLLSQVEHQNSCNQEGLLEVRGGVFECSGGAQEENHQSDARPKRYRKVSTQNEAGLGRTGLAEEQNQLEKD